MKSWLYRLMACGVLLTMAGTLTLFSYGQAGKSPGQQLVLAAGGRSDYQVIIPDELREPGTAEWIGTCAALIKDAFAANGSDLQVVTESRRDTSKPGIYLGDTRLAGSMGIESSGFEDWHYLLKVEGRDLIINGAQGTGRFGVVKGVCDFLREYAGTRFLYPGQTGMEFLHTPIISVPADLDLLKKPELLFNFSGNMYPEETLYNFANNHFPGDYVDFTGHMYHRAIPPEEYYKDHPEYFALIGGERYEKGKYSQYCISHPKVKHLILQYMVGLADEGKEIIYLGQPDAFRPCECDDCRDMYGTGDDWDEKVWLFHREIAEHLEHERPGFKIMILSYQATTHPPKTFRKFPGNTMVMLSHHYDEALAEWDNTEVPGGFTAYIEQFGSHFFTSYLPKREPDWLEAQVKRFCRHNLIGLTPDAGVYCYGLEGPYYYVWGRMFDDPENNNADELLDEFYTAAFGDAVDPMRRFYTILHRNVAFFSEWLSPRSPTHFRQGLDRKPTGIDDQLDWVRVPTARFGSRGMHRGILDPGQVVNIIYTPGMVREMESELGKAEDITVPDRVRRRIALVRMEFNYLKNVVLVNNLYNAHSINPGPASLERLIGAIDTWNALLDGFYDVDGNMKPPPDWPEIHPFRNHNRQAVGLITARWWRDKEKKYNPFAWDTGAKDLKEAGK